MWKAVIQNRLPTPKSFMKTGQTRSFWEYVNMMFNNPDHERIKLVGPDRACAEWVLRNGGSVIWTGGKKVSDYNLLPANDQQVPKLAVIDATDASISHYGFAHLNGCTMLHKIILKNSTYIDDRAMKGLEFGKDSLTDVEVSKCPDVTDVGVMDIKALYKLKTLVLSELTSVKNMEECKQYLKQQLPECDIKDSARLASGETLK